MRRRVVFPQPDGPMIVAQLPLGTSNEILSRTGIVPSREEKEKETPRTERRSGVADSGGWVAITTGILASLVRDDPSLRHRYLEQPTPRWAVDGHVGEVT